MGMNEEQIQKLIEMSKNRLTNRQMAINLGMKCSTLSYWKRILKDRGIDIPVVAGRRRKSDIPLIIGVSNE